MSYLYVNEQGASIGISGNRIEVRHKEGMLRSIPAETLEVIQVFGNVSVTTQCLAFCLQKGIDVIYYSNNGRYYGRLISPSHVNVQRQRIQAGINKDHAFCMDFSKKILDAKVRNQMVIIRRYARRSDYNIEPAIKEMKQNLTDIARSRTISQLMGYEGLAARKYFQTLGKLIIPEFSFSRRSRRPPEDAFNSMISLGYSILFNEIYGKIEAKGLNPYFGIMHSDRNNHPALVSDLMEEWRAVIVDSTAMSLANGHEIDIQDFYRNEGEPGIYLAPKAFKLFVKKFDNKLRKDNKYLSYVDGDVNFRRALDLQIGIFVRSIEEKNPDLYKPVIIR
ncbi:MAG: CRISPR-associated endonuclease Cas1 [Lachnospiraceae bacterium]|nr:CRISPR-associated endonuclease Cas1 [Lachnospiraceae bacterium]